MNVLRLLLTIVLVGGFSGCATKKAPPRIPLPVKSPVSEVAGLHNSQGIDAYQSKQFPEAKSHFQHAVAAAPGSAEAHYNLGLTLFALGDNDRAREQFIQAANLAPGDKVIWDSPALHQYGSPESNIPKQAKEYGYSNQRPTFGGGPR